MKSSHLSNEQSAYDYIIVGAGSAGCAVAGRLISLLPHIHIALIEPGEDYLSPDEREHAKHDPKDAFRTPAECPSLWNGAANRGYRSIPQTSLKGRSLSIVRASGVGGCSLINSMIWKRGFRQDWDKHMPRTFQGNVIEPEFQWLEDKIQPMTYHSNALGECGTKAAQSLGYEKAKDDTSWLSPGTSNEVRFSITKEGHRKDMYRALGANNENVHLVQGVAERIIFAFDCPTEEEKATPHATGVMIRRNDGTTEEIHVKENGSGGEVIVCCGTIDTPKLLQLSGVGPAKLLKGLDIPVVVDNPSVGEGLRDHILYPMFYETPNLPDKLSPTSVCSYLYDDSIDVEILFCDGAANPSFAIYSISEEYQEKMPSTNLIGKLDDFFSYMRSMALVHILGMLMGWIPSFRAKIQTTTGFLVNLMNPMSVGSVMIQSNDPSDLPIIDPAFLKEEGDMDTLLKGVTICKKIIKTAPMSNIIGKQLGPPPSPHRDTNDDDDIKKADIEDIRKFCQSYFHYTGTCSIGECLDDQLRFKGIDRLRVADASSLPFLPRTNTNASSMAVGARCASLIANT